MNGQLVAIDAFLRERRERLGWTQTEMSERINRSVGTVSKIEAARQILDMDTFIRMCDAMHISSSHVLLARREATDKTPLQRQITAIFRNALRPLGTPSGSSVRARVAKKSVGKKTGKQKSAGPSGRPKRAA